ncbi:MAG TPA: hypothetical protein VG929_05775 [Actinomycetota bacterium]|nr:hypothetical protein [Actinomycetota bacterium]
MVTTATRTGFLNDYGRVAGTFGLVTAVLVALSIILTFSSGAPPALDEASPKVMKYFQDNEGLHKITGIVNLLILITAPLWFLGLYSVLRDRATAGAESWPRVALVTFIVTGAVVAVQGGAALALTLGAKDEFQGTPAVGGALFDLYNALAAAVALTFGLYLIATAISLQQTGGFPAWWSTMLFIGGVASYISFLAPFTLVDVFAFIGLIPFIIFGIFAAVSGMAMQQRNTGAPRSPTI